MLVYLKLERKNREKVKILASSYLDELKKIVF